MNRQPRTDFATVPDTQAVAALDRDLRFHPTPPGPGRVLLAEQVEAFNRDGLVRPGQGDLRAIEGVAACGGPGGHGGQVRADRGQGRALRPEARELGMVQVAPCLALQDGLRQQCLAPQRHQAFGIEVSRVQ